jgi:microsomal dipeptidase-like Zn-dependent dipeptidase
VPATVNIVDALQCSHFDRDLFQELRAGGVTCVTATLGFWEDTLESLDAIGKYRDLARANDDLVLIARSPGDLERAARTGRTALLLGFQNSCALGGRIRYAELLADLDIRVMQLTYNVQNDVGGSCYDSFDGGLTRFGRELVEELNQVGILIDLSHVGERTTYDVLEASSRPVAFTHANPSALVPHRRNKSDELLRALAGSGGVVGIVVYRSLCGEYADDPQRWTDLVVHAVDVCGVEHVGIGTDLTSKFTEADIRRMRTGRWTRGDGCGAGAAGQPINAAPLDWFTSSRDFPVIANALAERGFAAHEVEAIMGGNWLRLYGEVFSAAV